MILYNNNIYIIMISCYHEKEKERHKLQETQLMNITIACHSTEQLLSF